MLEPLHIAAAVIVLLSVLSTTRSQAVLFTGDNSFVEFAQVCESCMPQIALNFLPERRKVLK